MKIYSIKAKTWDRPIYVIAPSIDKAISEWKAFRQSEITNIELIAQCPDGHPTVFLLNQDDLRCHAQTPGGTQCTRMNGHNGPHTPQPFCNKCENFTCTCILEDDL